MERLSNRYRFIPTAFLVGIIALVGARPDKHIMSIEDDRLREHVLSSYPFTYEAVKYLKSIPFFNRNTTTNGGGYYHDDLWGRWVEVFSTQDEAALHELSHAYFYHLVDEKPEFPKEFIKTADRIASNDLSCGFFFLLKHGQPSGNFKGIHTSNVSEWYASIASGYMGDVYNMPPAIRPYYQYEFIWNEGNQKWHNPYQPNMGGIPTPETNK